MQLKHRRILFWLLLAGLAGSSMAIYTTSDANFFLKTAVVLICQQVATTVIYLACFGWDLMRSK